MSGFWSGFSKRAQTVVGAAAVSKPPPPPPPPVNVSTGTADLEKADASANVTGGF